MKYLRTYEELTFDDMSEIISKSFIMLYFMEDKTFVANDNFILVLDPRGRNDMTDNKFIDDLAKFFIKHNINGEDYLGHISYFDLYEPRKEKYIKGLHCHYKSDQKIDINELKEFIKDASIRAKSMKYNL